MRRVVTILNFQVAPSDNAESAIVGHKEGNLVTHEHRHSGVPQDKLWADGKVSVFENSSDPKLQLL
jgi:hypothetical protein